MFGRSFKSKVALLIFSLGAGCAKKPFAVETATESSVRSGSGVNNGPGPVGDILKCQGNSESGESYEFVIRHTAAITILQGLLVVDNDSAKAVSMECLESVKLKVSNPDQPVSLWKCQESRNGDGRWSVEVNRQGLSSIVLGDVFQEQIFPLTPKKSGTMICKK